jgi:hypothetical protein
MANEIVRKDSIDYATEGLSPTRGQPLKFNAVWSRGYEGEAFDTNQDLLVTDTGETWRFLKKGAPAEYVPSDPASPLRPPRPNSFVDEASWPIYNGEPADPWQYCNVTQFLTLSNGETFHFCSNTAGSWVCRQELLEQIKSMRLLAPGALPIVHLATTSWKTQYGVRQRPMLKIVGWQKPKIEAAAPKQIEAEVVAEPPKEKAFKSKAKTPVSEMVTAGTERTNPFNDELPEGL